MFELKWLHLYCMCKEAYSMTAQIPDVSSDVESLIIHLSTVYNVNLHESFRMLRFNISGVCIKVKRDLLWHEHLESVLQLCVTIGVHRSYAFPLRGKKRLRHSLQHLTSYVCKGGNMGASLHDSYQEVIVIHTTIKLWAHISWRYLKNIHSELLGMLALRCHQIQNIAFQHLNRLDHGKIGGPLVGVRAL